MFSDLRDRRGRFVYFRVIPCLAFWCVYYAVLKIENGTRKLERSKVSHSKDWRQIDSVEHAGESLGQAREEGVRFAKSLSYFSFLQKTSLSISSISITGDKIV